MGKPRRFSPEFKARVMLEIVSGKKSLAEVSREHQIWDTVLQRWKTQFLEGLPEIFSPGQPAEQKRLRDRIAELERLAGKQALPTGNCKESQALLGVSTVRKRELTQLLSQEYRVTDCCAVLGLARSSYYHASQPRDDGALRKAISEIAAKYPTYGSRVESKPSCGANPIL